MLVTTDRYAPHGRLAHGAFNKERRRRRSTATLRPLTSPLTADEKRVANAIENGVRQARAQVKSERLLEAVRLRNPDEIVASVPIEPLRGIMAPVDVVYRDNIIWAANKAGNEFGINRLFNVVDREVIAYAATQSGRLINTITAEQLASLRGSIVDAVAGQYTVDDTAKIIRSTIGLTPRYKNAVSNNYLTVKAQRLAAGATERVASDFAERQAERYANRLLRSRAKTIARTEIITAQNHGKQVGWTQAIDEGAMGHDTFKEWTISSNACEICVALDGQTVPVLSAFTTGDLMPPAHPNCRCTANIVPSILNLYEQVRSERLARIASQVQ